MPRSLLSVGRHVGGALVLGLCLWATPSGAQGHNPAEYRDFIESLWPEARARGVSRSTFDEAFRGVSLNAKIIALTKNQSEFVRPIWQYVRDAVSDQRLEWGRRLSREWAKTLAAVERAYGVPGSIVLGVWGMETNFGSFTGNIDTVEALSTLAYAGYRGTFFRGELLAALQILQHDHVDRRTMTGSWAGAMGQTQFMPSSFLKFAVDGNRDGRRDIWASVPDALASTANYLRRHGWQPGLPWGYEVELPDGFDFRNFRQGFRSWAGLGVRRADGKAMPKTGEASLFLPAGANGPAFLVTDNFGVIKSYNSSDAYAIGVAHLGDRLIGGAEIRGAWPMRHALLDHGEREELQKHLSTLGFYNGEADGRFGSQTREAVRNFQLHRGLVPDGYADAGVLHALRASR
jgi:lytic murein transglycosylase